jgi:hypothetical protein
MTTPTYMLAPAVPVRLRCQDAAAAPMIAADYLASWSVSDLPACPYCHGTGEIVNRIPDRRYRSGERVERFPCHRGDLMGHRPPGARDARRRAAERRWAIKQAARW